MNNVDVGGYYEEDEFNDGYGVGAEGNPSFDRNDKVAKALSDVTTAPNELADYVKLLVSTHSQTSDVSDTNLVREIGNTLTKDKMVTATGRKLDVAVTMAVNCILGKNITIDYDENESVEKKREKHSHKLDRHENNDQPHQKKFKTSDSSRNYRSTHKNDNNYSYKERRGHQSQQHTQPRNHENGSYTPRYSNGSNVPPHNPSQRSGPPHSHPPNYGHQSRSRPLPPPPPPQRGPPHMHEMSPHRIAPPPYRQNRRDQSPGGYNNDNQYVSQSNGNGPHIRNGSNIPPPPPPLPPNHKHTPNYSNNKRSNPHIGQGHGHGHAYSGRSNDQKHIPSRNMKNVPPPPPPPPSQSHYPRQNSRSQAIPENERRTIFLSNIPPQITYNQLLSYFTRKMNVIVNTLQLQPMGMDQNYNKSNNRAKPENKAQKAYVELATHDQAMFIYHNPDPVLGNRFIGIEMHSVNLNVKGNKSSSNPTSQSFEKTTSQNSHQHPPKEKSRHSSKPTMLGDTGSKPRNPSPEDQQLLETLQKKQTLLQKQESLLEKQLAAHKKVYSLLKEKQNGESDTDSTVKLKEILALQKKLTQSKKDTLDILSKISDLEKKIGAQTHMKHFPISHNQDPKRYSLDKRTTTLQVTNFPDDTIEDALMRHFNAFGKVTSVEMHDNSANVTFANRIFAERAKNNASFFNDCTLVLVWHNKDGVGTGSNADTKEKYEEEESLQVESKEISNDRPTNENINLDIGEEGEEARWR